MTLPAVGAAIVLVAQLSAPAGSPAIPTPAESPASQIRFAGESPTPTLAEPPAGPPAGLGDPYGPAPGAERSLSQAPSSQQPIVTSAPRALTPADLMQSLVTSPSSQTVSGTPMKLGDVLETARIRREQTARTAAYWALSAAMIEAGLAEREATELATLRQEAPAAGAMWDAKERQLDTRLQLAEQAVLAAQRDLGRLMGIGDAAGDALPLAVDVPHCGRYETRYAEIFAGGADPNAEQLSRTLGLRHEQLRADATGVAEAAAWLDQARREAATNPAAASEVARAHDQISLQLREFVTAVRDYNQDIAAYAELAAPGNLGTDRLVGMLIRTTAPADSQAGDIRHDENVAPATALEPQNDPPAPRLTDAGAPKPRQRDGLFGNRTEVRRPLLDRLFNREHSILRRQR